MPKYIKLLDYIKLFNFSLIIYFEYTDRSLLLNIDRRAVSVDDNSYNVTVLSFYLFVIRYRMDFKFALNNNKKIIM